LEDCRISAKSIAQQLGISRERVGSIIHEDLDTPKLSTKWVSKCLNADQKRQRCQSSEQLPEFFRRDPNDFLSRLVTMDETWLHHYDPETKQQSMEWRHSGSPRPNQKIPSSQILKEKRRRKFTNGLLFLHDNAPTHRVLAAYKKLAYLGFQCLDHPPYSPDLDPSDYHLFPGL